MMEADDMQERRTQGLIHRAPRGADRMNQKVSNDYSKC
jgi:hypothetical protein